jgi:hypothetical protein
MILLRRWALVLCLALIPSLSYAAQRAVPMVEPAPIAIPQGVTDDQAAKVIKIALLQRSWLVSAESPGQIEGTLNLRQHQLRETFAYGNGQIVIKYVDSHELEFREEAGVRYIHPKFHNWNANLVQDINVEFTKVMK